MYETALILHKNEGVANRIQLTKDGGYVVAKYSKLLRTVRVFFEAKIIKLTKLLFSMDLFGIMFAIIFVVKIK